MTTSLKEPPQAQSQGTVSQAPSNSCHLRYPSATASRCESHPENTGSFSNLCSYSCGLDPHTCYPSTPVPTCPPAPALTSKVSRCQIHRPSSAHTRTGTKLSLGLLGASFHSPLPPDILPKITSSCESEQSLPRSPTQDKGMWVVSRRF